MYCNFKELSGQRQNSYLKDFTKKKSNHWYVPLCYWRLPPLCTGLIRSHCTLWSHIRGMGVVRSFEHRGGPRSNYTYSPSPLRPVNVFFKHFTEWATLLSPWKGPILIRGKHKVTNNLSRPTSDTTSIVFESDRTVPVKFLKLLLYRIHDLGWDKGRTKDSWQIVKRWRTKGENKWK
jgi:hypothetical protein